MPLSLSLSLSLSPRQASTCYPPEQAEGSRTVGGAVQCEKPRSTVLVSGDRNSRQVQRVLIAGYLESRPDVLQSIQRRRLPQVFCALQWTASSSANNGQLLSAARRREERCRRHANHQNA